MTIEELSNEVYDLAHTEGMSSTLAIKETIEEYIKEIDKYNREFAAWVFGFISEDEVSGKVTRMFLRGYAEFLREQERTTTTD